jgi:hypothetical protein
MADTLSTSIDIKPERERRARWIAASAPKNNGVPSLRKDQALRFI